MATDKFITLEELNTTTQALLSKINEQSNLKVDKINVTNTLDSGTKIGSIDGKDFYAPSQEVTQDDLYLLYNTLTDRIPLNLSDLNNNAGYITTATQIKSNWNETTTANAAFIFNKPAIKASATGTNSIIINDIEHNMATGNYSYAEGGYTKAIKQYSHAEGYYSQATAQYAHAEGYNTLAAGSSSHSEGGATKAIGESSHAEGYYSEALAQYSHAEGFSTQASGAFSHAEGQTTTASGAYSHSEGYQTISAATATHAEGFSTQASGASSHAEGLATIASGIQSHAEGEYTIAQRKSQHVFGEYNTADPTGTTSTHGTFVEIVGNGTATTRSNARTLDWSGNETLAGKLTVGIAPTANMDVATKKYVDDNISSTIGNGNAFNVSVVQSLPSSNIDTHTIYFVSNSGDTGNIYDEYMYINNSWEKLGTTEIDLNKYWATHTIAVTYDSTNDEYSFFESKDGISGTDLTLEDVYNYLEEDFENVILVYGTELFYFSGATSNGIYIFTSPISHDKIYLDDNNLRYDAYVKPTYTAAEVGALPDTTVITDEKVKVINANGIADPLPILLANSTTASTITDTIRKTNSSLTFKPYYGMLHSDNVHTKKLYLSEHDTSFSSSSNNYILIKPLQSTIDNTYTINVPSQSGTLALTSNIPDISTKVNKAGDTMTGDLNFEEDKSWRIIAKESSGLGTPTRTIGLKYKGQQGGGDSAYTTLGFDVLPFGQNSKIILRGIYTPSSSFSDADSCAASRLYVDNKSTLKTTASSNNTEYNLLGTATTNNSTTAVSVYSQDLLSFAKTTNLSRLTVGSTSMPGVMRLYTSTNGANGYADLKVNVSGTNAREITFPDKSGTVAMTDDIPSVPSWALNTTKPSYAFSELTSHPTTLNDYGITDAYTKTEVDGLVSGVLHYKGTKATTSALPSSGNITGDVWHITADGSEWAWDGSTWQELGTATDLSGYLQTSDIAAWAKAANKPTYTASEVGALSSSAAYVSSFNGESGAITYVPPVTSVNGQTGAVTITADSVGAAASSHTHTEIGNSHNPTNRIGRVSANYGSGVTLEHDADQGGSSTLKLYGSNITITTVTDGNFANLKTLTINDGQISGLVDPTTATMAATKQYVDNSIPLIIHITDPSLTGTYTCDKTYSEISTALQNNRPVIAINDMAQMSVDVRLQSNQIYIPLTTIEYDGSIGLDQYILNSSNQITQSHYDFTIPTSGSGNITVTNTLQSGTLIATINGTNIYAPAYTDADGVSY